MEHLHYEVNANAGDVVQVTLDKQANVRVMDKSNYQRFCCGEQHKFRGGLAKVSPANIPLPHSGYWVVVVDLGGYAGKVRASVRVIQRR